jgi:hypothetical protein
MFLILINFLIILIYLYLVANTDLGESVIRSYLLILIIVVALTELLSLADLITRSAVMISWSVISLINLIFLIRKLRQKKSRIRDIIKDRHREDQKPSTPLELVILICIGLILLTTLMTAVLAPPNNFDSMTYHMSRISNWIQNQNIKYYPTAIPRQNYSLPLAEYVILHLQIMSRSDLYANLVQWSAMGVALLLVAKLAAYFQISRRGQLLSAFFTATIPMAILQSSSTQNDLITGLACLSFAYYLLRTFKERSWMMVFFAGLSLGIALMTKGTAYLFCAAVGSVVCVSELVLRTWNIRSSFTRKILAIVGMALLINTAVYIRNIDLYGNPLSTGNDRITSDQLSMRGLYTNLIRNGAAQLAVPIPELNEKMTRVVADHLGKNNIDPAITFPGSVFEIKFLINEDEAGNLLHFILLAGGGMIYLWIKDPNRRSLSIYLLSIICSVILFSLTIKYQPWGSRLQLANFFLAAPLIGYLTDRIRGSHILSSLIVISLSIYSVPYLTLNASRPLIPVFRQSSPLHSKTIKRFFSNRPALYEAYAQIIAPFYKDESIFRTDRNQQYFSSSSSLYQDYSVVMNEVNQLDEEVIGLALGSNDWEYPIWVLAGRSAVKGTPEFIHVGIENNTGSLNSTEDDWPDYLITTREDPSIFTNDYGYQVLLNTQTIDLLHRLPDQ